jgi:phosphate transport system protein
MATRLAFDTELRDLQDELVAMADVVGRSIRQAIQALTERNAELAHAAIASDERINEFWVSIERLTLQIIATQQPMATDLREILAIHAIATDLERIGDYAKGIASIALRMLDEPEPEPLHDIAQLADLVCELLDAEITAFVQRDPASARAAALRDNEVDALYHRIYRQLIARMTRQPQTINATERLLWTSKSLERMGDHTTNIGERVVFVATGEIVELNS